MVQHQLPSLFTAILYSDLQPFSSEILSITLLDKANVKISIKQFAQKAMLNLNKFKKYFHKNKQKDVRNNPRIQQRVSQIKYIFQKSENLRRNYKTIDNEDLITMAERKFKEMNNFFNQYNDMLEQMQSQQVVLVDLNTPIIQSIQKNNTVIFANDVRNKEDKYFEELIDSQSQYQLLMKFNNEE
ncbi:unnamed protein product [Paramecium sonneborni]|uniref:Uncharacterized protein n=1 Tax=Paramecium sonneborni TaxID=65129 RepID=A0A8S1MJV6_9CILI|nr:unnamed protein product [Paramecium sonneborni]